jgi:transposase
MEFREISDYEWEVIGPLPPPMSRVGRPRTKHMIREIQEHILG